MPKFLRRSNFGVRISLIFVRGQVLLVMNRYLDSTPSDQSIGARPAVTCPGRTDPRWTLRVNIQFEIHLSALRSPRPLQRVGTAVPTLLSNEFPIRYYNFPTRLLDNPCDRRRTSRGAPTEVCASLGRMAPDSVDNPAPGRNTDWLSKDPI